MASEITPGQRTLLIGATHQSVQLPDFDGFVFTPRTPGRKDTRIYAARTDLLPLDDLREVLRGARSLASSVERIVHEIENSRDRLPGRCCDTWWDGGRREHWDFCIVTQLRQRIAEVDAESAASLLARLGDGG